MKCVLIALMMFFLSSCIHAPENSIAGIWYNPQIKGGTIEIKSANDQYETYQVADDSKTLDPGELIAEFHFKENNTYIGRHKWGGNRTGPISWGDPDGMEITFVNEDEFFMVYHDSRYTSGWTFTRVKH